MIAFEKIKVGMVLFDIHRHKVGNVAGMTELGCWDVVIVELRPDGAMVRWNGNPVRFWPRHRLEKLYAKKTKALLKQEEARRARWGH